MTTQKKILKGMIIFIMVAFLLSTALTSIMYLGGAGKATTGENLTGIVETTGVVDATGILETLPADAVATGTVATGN